jgi:hypothetical protein
MSAANHGRPDQGSISRNVYAIFFDLTFEFPKSWIPHGEATKRHLMVSSHCVPPLTLEVQTT